MARDAQIPFLIIVSEPDAGRLDQFLAKSIPDQSRSTFQHWISRGFVKVNGEIVKSGLRLRLGDRVEITKPDISLVPTEEPPVSLDIIYEDASILVINKPAGLIVHPGAGTYGKATVVGALVAYLGQNAQHLPGDPNRVGIVHRLDKDTSGVMVIAKTLEAHRGLTQQFKDKTNLREYVALLDGVLPASELCVETYLHRDPKNRLRFASISVPEYEALLEEGRELQGYRYAKTFFVKNKVYGQRLTLATLRLSTGRTHQIRVHSKSLGCPVLGDDLYGRRTGKLPGHFPAEVRSRALELEHQLLHARRLGFIHPSDGRKLAFEAPLPKEFRGMLELLEKFSDH